MNKVPPTTQKNISAAVKEISAERRAHVESAREQWIKNLIDLSRRNNLLYYRELKKGTLDLSSYDPEEMAKIFAGKEVSLRRLLLNSEDEDVAAIALEIRRRARANLEEKGLQTLFLSFGMATWTPVDGGRPPEAAILLIPVDLELRGKEGRSFALRRSGEIQVNLVLLHMLETLGFSISPDELIGQGAEDEEDQPFNHEEVYRKLRDATARLKGFSIASRVVLGNFAFQKMAMVKDLRERSEEMAQHEIIAALAGDPGARGGFQAHRVEIDPRNLDKTPPDNEFLVRDADSSQQRVVQAVVDGQSGVIQGAPGTGKSQTITNLIASLIGAGKKVLFVAEKRAALEVVLNRLEGAGLGHLALDLHGADISRRSLMEQLEDSLKRIHNTPLADVASTHARFVERRNRLNEHDARMHTPRQPSGLSIYDLQGYLLRIPPDAISHLTTWRSADLNRLDTDNVQAIKNLLVEAGGFDRSFFGDTPSPWVHAPLTSGARVQAAIDLVRDLHTQHLPALLNSTTAIVQSTGLREPSTFQDVIAMVDLLDGVARTLQIYSPDVFTMDLIRWQGALAPAQNALKRTWASLIDSNYRLATREVLALRMAGPSNAAQLLLEVKKVLEQLNQWRNLSNASSMPVAFARVDEARQRLSAAMGSLKDLIPLLATGHVLAGYPNLALGDAVDQVNRLALDTVTPYRLPRIYEIQTEIARRGGERILQELKTTKVAPAVWPHVFEHAWLASCLDQARADDPLLAGFNGRAHEVFVQDFAHLDETRIKLASDRVRRSHAERAIAALNSSPEQAALVEREVQKRSRHLPLRTLLKRAPDVITALRPCWMASPLTVSQLIDGEHTYFDVVIFDEASQVLPEDAAPALLRAPNAVVAGDRHQLPPTTFFAASDDDESEDTAVPAAVAGFGSVLDLMEAVFSPAWQLEWHYRSRDESLIAFANHEIYHDGLITYPGSNGGNAVSHVLVETMGDRDGQEESSTEEVQEVVKLVLRHAEERPGETLGVIALGIDHARRIEAALDQAISERSDLAGFFDEQNAERFFVKNLERVQGDERDAIILSIGCRKDSAGKVSRTQFGPLNSRDAGPRRLNVAITRARSRMTVVSSFSHVDLAPSSFGDSGVDLLRKYLEYAASGGRRISGDGPTTTRPNPFELDVQEALERRGLRLRHQWGASKYRIDLVAEHPTQPGRFILAIECDGASYHSAPTARDRDRLRQQHLQALGWKFHRIWSTDWFTRREEEIERAYTAYQNAVASADAKVVPKIMPPVSRLENSPAAKAGPESIAPKPAKRPPVSKRDTIDDYPSADIDRLVSWINSDGLLRTDEEVVTRMVEELGFKRRGPRIDHAIRAAIARVGAKPK